MVSVDVLLALEPPRKPEPPWCEGMTSDEIIAAIRKHVAEMPTRPWPLEDTVVHLPADIAAKVGRQGFRLFRVARNMLTLSA